MPSMTTLLRTLSFLACSLQLYADTIITKTLDFGSDPFGDTGKFTSQAVVNGNPAIAYYNESESNLMFARNSAADGSGTWTITTVDYDATVGQYCSLAVIQGHPAISYYDATPQKLGLRYVRALDASGTNWGMPASIKSIGIWGQHTSLIEINGQPNISCYDVSKRELVFVRNTTADGSGPWTLTTVDHIGEVGEYSSLRLVDGHPAISYYDATNKDLKYARSSLADGSGAWTLTTADSEGTVGTYTSLAEINGHPAISYYDSTNGDLKYARNSLADGSGTWTLITVDSEGTVGRNTSLTVVNGNPAISYFALTNFDLKYARNSLADGSGSWSVTTADSIASVGEYASLAVVNGNPAVSYYSFSGTSLKFVRSSDASGTSWAPATTPDAGVQSGDVGQYTSHAIVNGNPAVAYYDVTNGDLKYARNSLPDGLGTWTLTPVTMTTLGNTGQYPSLRVINGKPAISFSEFSPSSSLKYARNSLADGSGTWTITTVEPLSSTYSSLFEVNGKPAISYYIPSGDLYYARNSLADGSGTWTLKVVASTDDVGAYNSLAVVNGKPAISCYDRTSGNLKYARNSLADGSGTWTLTTVDSTDDVGKYSSLTVVDGKPAISYYDVTNGDLKYARNSLVDGSGAWTRLTVDGVGEVGTYASLAVVNGKPGISYYDGTLKDLKYARSSMTDGSGSWTVTTVDSTFGSVGTYSSLAVANGNPIFSYYDIRNYNLKWATIIPAPEIAIEQPGGTNLSNGEGMAFGNLGIGSSIDLIFTIRNLGTLDLNLTGMPSASMSGSSDFMVTVQPASPVIVSNGSTTFTVRFAPSSPGFKAATLSIFNNDPDEPTFTLNFTGSNTLDPIFSGYTLKAVKNTPVSVGKTKLLSRAADADGGVLAISGVGALSAQGGSLVLGASSIGYSPPVDFTGLDTFGLTIIDGQGGSVVGTVTVNVGEGNAAGSGNEPQITVQPGGSVALLFQAIPGQSYRVERSTDLQAWTLLETVTAASDGTLPCVDPDPPAGSAFYRLVVP